MATKSSEQSLPRIVSPACVIAIGGSAGALESFERFFRSVAVDLHASFIVLQHMDPGQKSLLPELLSHWTRIPVEIPKHDLRLQPYRVYVREPGTILEVKDGRFVVRREATAERLRHPIDVFMEALAADASSRAIGAIFSGTGSDGTLGLRRIQDAGGKTLVQDPSEAKFDGMPESAISAGVVDRVMRVEDLAKELGKLIECSTALVSESDDGKELARVCEVLQKRTGHDFSSYKKSTVARRVERRLHATFHPDLPSYIEFLERDPAEPRALLRDLLISVTRFFRDPEAFEALGKDVIPRLFENVSAGEAVRVWVPACATGEEVYSIAVLLRSYQREKYPHVALQIFATDIDRAALEFARQGIYPASIEEQVPAEHLARFFKKHEKGYQVSLEIREICLFSEHSLLKHPPFSKIDLISCRNLFIYWEPELQSRVLPVFHYALNATGFLFLGPAESVASTSELFKVIDKKSRIFQRAGGMGKAHVFFPISSIAARSVAPLEALQRSQVFGERDPGKAIAAALLENYAPPAFVVSERGEVAYYSGRVGRYIDVPSGVPSNNLFDVIAPSLRPELHALLHRSARTRLETTLPGFVFEKDGVVQKLDLFVRPMPEFTEELGAYLVVLQEIEPPKQRAEALREGMVIRETDTLVQHLEEELRETRAHLQSTIEEVKSSNEELLSMNEELQSANEELQTSKEELQSTNEELETVNSELARKLEELDASNSDLQNFFHGTQVPILFLDREFRVQKFTPAATKIFRLIPTDVGRGILDIATVLEGSDFIADCASVLKSLQPLDRELMTRDLSASYLMRISPYRTLSDVIAGVIVAFSDVTELKKAQEAKSTLAAIVESTSDAIVGRDLEGNVTSWNSGAERVFGYSAREALGRPITLIIPADKQDEFRRLEKVVMQGESVSNVDTERVRKDGRRISVTKTMSPILGRDGGITGLSVIYRDVSDRKRAEVESATLAAIVRSSNDAIISKDLTGTVKSWNEAATQMFGHTADEMVGQSIRKLIPQDKQGEEDMILEAINRGQPITHYETERMRKDGTLIQVSVSVSPVRDAEGRVVGAAKIARDITPQKATEAALREAVAARDEFLSIASHELKTPLTSLKLQAHMRKRALLKEGAEPFSIEQMIKMIDGDERQISRLTRLIDDMLDIARISSGKLTVAPEPVALEGLVREVAERFQDQLKQAGCHLGIEIRSPVEGNWDRFRIEQVVANLLSNAMKYGPGKPITVRVEGAGETARLTVEDKGVGISPKDQERIFNQFERAVSPNEVSGLGLGLYIVREILDAHGGTIRVESEQGRGARFIVDLPRNTGA